MTEKTITVYLQQQSDYRFEIHFDDNMPVLTSDEPVPLGTGTGPSPVQLLCAAVGNCLSDSLLFAFRKFKQTPEPIQCEVQAQVGRNEQGRIRVLKIAAKLKLGVAGTQLEHAERVLSQFEEFCTVTQSVGQGIPIHTRVLDVHGVVLKD
ncbi:MAG: OsmC family protein [Limnohabitans sp.]